MEDVELVQAALFARERAYAPYSRYRVGAALLADDGSVHQGCNVENASYGLTVCAERTAVFSGVAAGRTRFVTLAVATEDGASMCGACRQVVREFGESIRVLLANGDGEYRETTVAALLPDSFGPDSLDGDDPA